MAVDPRLAMRAAPRVQRFGLTERRLHTVHALAFSVLLFTGFALYLPMLAQIISDRPLMKAVHLVAAVGWMTALALVLLLGDRAALRRTRREIERFDDDDLLFLRRRPAAAGRFNGGQKVHAILEAGLSLLFVVSGALLWFGERNTDLRLPGTIALHDAATLLLSALVVGHICRAIAQRGSVEGIRRGTVTAAYAAEHHPRWRPDATPADTRGALGALGAGRIAAAIVVVVAGLVTVTLLV